VASNGQNLLMKGTNMKLTRFNAKEDLSPELYAALRAELDPSIKGSYCMLYLPVEVRKKYTVQEVRDPRAVRDEAIKAMFDSGMTVNAINKHFTCSYRTIYRVTHGK